MSTTTKIGDDFLCVPKLDVAGTNWVIYKDHIIWSIDAHGLLEHIDGSESEPVDPITRSEGAVLSTDELVAEAEWKKLLKAWKQGEAIVKQQIAGTIPDSLFMKVCGQGTAKGIWEALSKDFQNKSLMVSVDLCRRLQEEKCIEKGDVRAHFSKLRTMHEDLSAMGKPPTDADFYMIILASLPPSYNPYISAVNATSSVLRKTLSSDSLILTVTEEYEH